MSTLGSFPKAAKRLNLLPARRNKFQQIADFAFEHRAYPGENVDIQPGYAVVAVIVDLRALHFRPVAQFVFTDSLFFISSSSFILIVPYSIGKPSLCKNPHC